MGRLSSLELKYELWSVPFARPFAFNQAMTHMIGFRQAIPTFGSASYPDFMVEFDYMNQPMQPKAHGYGGMVSMTLPLSAVAQPRQGRNRARGGTKRRRRTGTARLRPLLTVDYEVVAARERYRAGREIEALVEGRSVPVARRTYGLEREICPTSPPPSPSPSRPSR